MNPLRAIAAAVRPLSRAAHRYLPVRSLAVKRYNVSPEDRAKKVLNARLSEPKLSEQDESVRQLRIAGMLERAMNTVLDDRVVEDPDLYPDGFPVEIVSAYVSPCLKYATFLWSVPVVGRTRPEDFVPRLGKRNLTGASTVDDRHGPTEHLSPEMQLRIELITKAFARNMPVLKAALVPRIRMKVRGVGRQGFAVGSASAMCTGPMTDIRHSLAVPACCGGAVHPPVRLPAIRR